MSRSETFELKGPLNGPLGEHPRFELVRPCGVRLRGRCWRPAQAAAPRAVYLVHGLGEHIGRYQALAQWFNARGWTVCGHDHRGHGRSDGKRGALSRTGDLVDDLAAAIDAARRTLSAPPLLLGHSLGGLVAVTYALRHPDRISGLVLSSPALDPGLSSAQRALVAVLSRLAPGLTLRNGLDASKISHDAATVRAYREDPLVHDRIGLRLARFLADASREAIERAAALSVRSLLLFAGDDRLVDPDGSRRFAQRAPQALLTVREYPALWHEIFNETEIARRAVLDDLAQWL